MNKEELIQFLKDNLKLSIDYDGYNYDGEIYKVSILLEDEEICNTSFNIDYNNKFSC